MATLEDINQNLKAAMLAKDELQVSVLRMLKTDLMKIEKEGGGTEITDEVVANTAKRMIKQRRDSAEQFKKGDRIELAEKEEAEIKFLEAYMPEQLSEEVVRDTVKETITELSVTDKNGMGKVMGVVMGKLKGQADGSLVKKIVEEEL